MAFERQWILDSNEKDLTGLASLFVTSFYRSRESRNGSYEVLDPEVYSSLLNPEECRESFEESLNEVAKYMNIQSTPEEAVDAFKKYVSDNGLDPKEDSIILLVWW
jgi:hypothetical protein